MRVADAVGPGSRKWKNDCWVVGCLGGCPGQFFGKNRLGFVWGFPSGNIKKKTGSGTFVEGENGGQFYLVKFFGTWGRFDLF